jgi:hypothetical protein
LESEPVVEVLRCSPIDKPRAGYRDLSSTRFLDFRPNRELYPDLTLTAHALRDRLHVRRTLLQEADPDPHRVVSQTTSRRIAEWYALRYTRPAWPDEFVRRIRPKHTALVAALETIKDDVAEVRIALEPNDQDLEAERDYAVAVFFIVDSQTWGSSLEGRHSVYEAFTRFVAELNGCTGIAVNETVSDVLEGTAFSWEDMRVTDKWNFAHLSLVGQE